MLQSLKYVGFSFQLEVMWQNHCHGLLRGAAGCYECLIPMFNSENR